MNHVGVAHTVTIWICVGVSFGRGMLLDVHKDISAQTDRTRSGLDLSAPCARLHDKYTCANPFECTETCTVPTNIDRSQRACACARAWHMHMRVQIIAVCVTNRRDQQKQSKENTHMCVKAVQKGPRKL